MLHLLFDEHSGKHERQRSCAPAAAAVTEHSERGAGGALVPAREVRRAELQLQNAKAPGAAAAAARKTVTYGTARFTIAAGKTKTVEVKLNVAGRALLAKKRQVQVWANSVVGSGASRQVRSAKLTGACQVE